MNSISGLSIQGLATLNAILGSTESSRAVAAIITLIRDELNKPEVGGTGEVVTYLDLIVGTIGFVLLQRWGRRKTELDFREAGGEEAIWDAVIDDKGFRADVVGTRRKGMISLNTPVGGPAMTFASPDGEDEFEALERGTLYDAQAVVASVEDQTKLTDEEIRERIMSQLPAGARAVITSETITAKTIKVEIYDAQTSHIDPPPGTVMVAERLNHDTPMNGAVNGPHQTVIFRTALKRSSSTEMPSPADQLRLTAHDSSPPDHPDPDDILMMKSAPKRISIVDEPIQIEPQTYSNSDREEEAVESSSPPTSSPPKSDGPIANQKKSRRPVFSSNKSSSGASGTSRIPVIKTKKEKSSSASKSEKGGVLKKALKTLSPSQSSAAVKELNNAPSQQRKPLPTLPVQIPRSRAPSASRGDLTPHKTLASLSHGPTPLTSPSLHRAAESSTSYFAVQHRRRDSIVSQTTETFSVHSLDSRPGSPTFKRTRTRVVNGLTPTRSELGMALDETESRLDTNTGTIHHRRSRSFVPSLYSMATKDSAEAILLVPKTPVPRKSIYEDHSILASLVNDGKVPGIFPDRHLVKTVRRFARFASASYGSNFLRVMGLTTTADDLSKSTELMTLNVHHEHSSFSSHTGLPPDTILLSSFYDPKGVTGNTDWSPSAISPLIHFISIDDESKAVVLTCRGTLGFEDVLTDMTCDYDDILWQGQRYKVHKGIHASARRLLGGSGSRIMATIRATLEQYPDYGLVLCGHSLGGAVAAILAILISEPSFDDSRTAFVTSTPPKLLTHTPANGPSYPSYIPPITLPAGRPIHVYAYGTPACMSELLRSATRGLITTIANNADIVPCLSLGILHDFRTVALHLKHDTTDALGALKSRVWNRLSNAVKSAFYNNPKGPPAPENMAGDGLGEDTWAWAALKTLRAAMVNDKLVPPGEVFVVETTRVFDRLDPDVAREAVFGPDDSKDDRTEKLYRALGRPATRVRFLWVRDVERRFGELRFGRDMFGDHSPGRYEAALAALERGICEE
jgi:pimeloyl-ACP methyl ester carboxylesterase